MIAMISIVFWSPAWPFTWMMALLEALSPLQLCIYWSWHRLSIYLPLIDHMLHNTCPKPRCLSSGSLSTICLLYFQKQRNTVLPIKSHWPSVNFDGIHSCYLHYNTTCKSMKKAKTDSSPLEFIIFVRKYRLHFDEGCLICIVYSLFAQC